MFVMHGRKRLETIGAISERKISNMTGRVIKFVAVKQLQLADSFLSATRKKSQRSVSKRIAPCFLTETALSMEECKSALLLDARDFVATNTVRLSHTKALAAETSWTERAQFWGAPRACCGKAPSLSPNALKSTRAPAPRSQSVRQGPHDRLTAYKNQPFLKMYFRWGDTILFWLLPFSTHIIPY